MNQVRHVELYYFRGYFKHYFCIRGRISVVIIYYFPVDAYGTERRKSRATHPAIKLTTPGTVREVSCIFIQRLTKATVQHKISKRLC